MFEPFFLAVLMGLRHATDPDHLTAVASLVLGDARHGSSRAGRLGLAWGLATRRRWWPWDCRSSSSPGIFPQPSHGRLK